MISTQSFGQQITNGHSSYTKITGVASYWDHTIYVTENATACGSTFGWRLDLTLAGATDPHSDIRKQKAGMLLAAYVANRVVYLRCENGRLTDFTLND